MKTPATRLGSEPKGGPLLPWPFRRGAAALAPGGGVTRTVRTGWHLLSCGCAGIRRRACGVAFIAGRVVPGWLNDSQFLAGYGAAQAVPGRCSRSPPISALWRSRMRRWREPLLALAMIFLPGLLLIAGGMPFRASIAGIRKTRAAIAGVNAAVEGILAAALFYSLWTTGIASLADALIALAGFALLVRFTPPPLVVVVVSVAASTGYAAAGWA
ncbi:chromate transporter [Sphingopyxis sp.]|uniref:chromate transporter n=1 Tax=Sphingopyxis sp. TaxID=1908224 RepID=UPI0025E7B6C8|nr:chromate transporter [Sphingopyxis sp.]